MVGSRSWALLEAHWIPSLESRLSPLMVSSPRTLLGKWKIGTSLPSSWVSRLYADMLHFKTIQWEMVSCVTHRLHQRGLHFCQIPLPFNVLSLNFHKSLMVLVNITYPFFFFIEKNWSLDRLNGFPTATLVSQRNVCMNYEAQRRFIDSPSVIVFTIMW